MYDIVDILLQRADAESANEGDHERSIANNHRFRNKFHCSLTSKAPN
jgi:hypothetical protein